jgi:hypothetical protein
MDQEILFKILEAGAQAPSGSNSQPWKFKVTGNQIEVIALPEKDHPILNFRYRGTWVAHGALIENLLIAATAFGYKTNLELFPLSPACQTTAKITLLEDANQPKDELYEAIFTRATNRKPYADKTLTAEQKTRLTDQAKKIGIGEFRLIEDKPKINALAKASSTNEILLLGDRGLHELFVKEIVWTEKEEREKRTGLYLKTMELQPPQEKALQLFKHWQLMKFFNLFGAAKAIAKTNEKSYKASSAVAAIIINDNDNDFLSAGRIMERVWLEAAGMGLSCHLMSGILFFWQRLKNHPDNTFSPKHQKLISQAYAQIAAAVGITDPGKTIAILMRIGDGGRPSALSSRFPVKNTTQIIS